jgi:hypothetical protein
MEEGPPGLRLYLLCHPNDNIARRDGRRVVIWEESPDIISMAHEYPERSALRLFFSRPWTPSMGGDRGFVTMY